MSAPFAGQADADLAVAYVACFILVFYRQFRSPRFIFVITTNTGPFAVTLFPFRGTILIQRDYTHPPKEVEDEENVTQSRWSKVKAASEHVRSLPELVRRRKGGRQQAEKVEGMSEAEDGDGEKAGEAGTAEPGSSMRLRSTRSPPTAFSDLQCVLSRSF